MASSDSDDAKVQAVLGTAFGRQLRDDRAFIAAGMALSELVLLYQLVRDAQSCSTVLEVGMANGTSTVVMCAALQARGGGHLTSVDPFQTSDYHRKGVEHVARAGFASRHTLVEEPNYLALPQMVIEKRQFDLVFIDGWHSFDYAMLDMFYADLLLPNGGVVVFHDTDTPAVYKALRFLETHKPYERLSPPPAVALPNLRARASRRIGTILKGPRAVAQSRARRGRWRTLTAYRKRQGELTPERLVGPF